MLDVGQFFFSLDVNASAFMHTYQQDVRACTKAWPLTSYFTLALAEKWLASTERTWHDKELDAMVARSAGVALPATPPHSSLCSPPHREARH